MAKLYGEAIVKGFLPLKPPTARAC